MKPTTKWLITGAGLTAWIGFATFALGAHTKAIALVTEPDPASMASAPTTPSALPQVEIDPTPAISQGVVTVDGVEVPFIEANKPSTETTNIAEVRQPTVLLLHGAGFNETNWLDSGVLNELAEHDVRAIAVRLPKAGEPPKFTVPDTIDPGSFLNDTIGALGVDSRDLVIVSPSFSGFYTLDMLEQYPSMELGGFVPVAPKNVENLDELPAWQMSNIPTLIMWAESDNRIPTADVDKGAEALKEKMPSSTVSLYETEEHAFYFATEEMTNQFTNDLLVFLQGATSQAAQDVA